jgi:predicted nucleotidyltransferase
VNVPAEKLAIYREGLRRRLSQPLTATERAALEGVWLEALQVATRLIELHNAKRVLLFGSVANNRRLRRESDIDLAVEGMPIEDYYQVVGDLRTPSGRSIDLVRLETVRESFRKLILMEGVLLAHAGE